jgi:hypothetical protein
MPADSSLTLGDIKLGIEVALLGKLVFGGELPRVRRYLAGICAERTNSTDDGGSRRRRLMWPTAAAWACRF